MLSPCQLNDVHMGHASCSPASSTSCCIGVSCSPLDWLAVASDVTAVGTGAKGRDCQDHQSSGRNVMLADFEGDSEGLACAGCLAGAQCCCCGQNQSCWLKRPLSTLMMLALRRKCKTRLLVTSCADPNKKVTSPSKSRQVKQRYVMFTSS